MNYRINERPVNKSPGLSRLFAGQTADSTIPYHSRNRTEFKSAHYEKFIRHLYQVSRKKFSWVEAADLEDAIFNSLENIYNLLNSPDRNLVFNDVPHAFRYINTCCANALCQTFKERTRRINADREFANRTSLNNIGILSLFETIEIHYTVAKAINGSGMKRILSKGEFSLLEILTEASKNQTESSLPSRMKNKQFIITICRILSKNHPNVLVLICRLKHRLKKLYKNDRFYRSAIDVLTEQKLYDKEMQRA